MTLRLRRLHFETCPYLTGSNGDTSVIKAEDASQSTLSNTQRTMEFTFTRNNPRNTELVGPGFRYQVSSSTMGRHRTISRDAEVLGEVEFHAWTSDILRMGGKSLKVKEFMPTTSWSGRWVPTGCVPSPRADAWFAVENALSPTTELHISGRSAQGYTLCVSRCSSESVGC